MAFLKSQRATPFREEVLEYPEIDSHHENHLLLQLPILIVFGANFPVEM